MKIETLDKAIFLQGEMARCDYHIKNLQDAIEQTEIKDATCRIDTSDGYFNFTIPKDYLANALKKDLEEKQSELEKMQKEFEKL